MRDTRILVGKSASNLILLAIVSIGLVLRFYHLGFQSLWLDEIHTAIESDPSYRDRPLSYYLHYVDQQPPLFFFLERLAIVVFGNNEMSLRIIPALAGTASIWGMYLVGKEVQSRRVGLFAAFFIAVNSFCIYYSNEARPYSVALFFSLISWLYFIRFTETQNLFKLLKYGVASLLMIYTSYFSVFVVTAQALLAVVLWFEAPDRKKFAIHFSVACLIILLGFAPLTTYLRSISSIQTFWADKPGEDTGIVYFFQYFGESELLKPFLLLLLICFIVRLIIELREEEGIKGIRASRMTFLFTLCSIWIFVCLFIPFLRSYLVVPMMVTRYTIMVVPAFVLLIACGLDFISSRVVRTFILTFFSILSLTHLLVINEYYHRPSKTQFRDLIGFMSLESSLMYPVVTKTTAWHQQYYMRRFHYRNPILEDKNGATIDSLTRLKLPFWLTSVHQAIRGENERYEKLDTGYTIAKEIHLLDAWGRLYIPKNYMGDSGALFNAYSYPPERRYLETENNQFIALWWTQRLDLNPVRLKAGNYECVIVAKGTSADGIYPHFECFINDKRLGSYYLSVSPRDTRAFKFSLEKDTMATISIVYDNDAMGTIKTEDRNAFIHSVFVTMQR